MTIVDLKKEYRKHLSIISNDDNGNSTKVDSLAKLTSAYNDILKEEPKCKIDSPDVIKKAFIDKVDNPDVVWYTDDQMKEEMSKSDEEELVALEKIRELAYIWVKRNHPRLPEQGDKFGQIVNARMNLIILSRQ